MTYDVDCVYISAGKKCGKKSHNNKKCELAKRKQACCSDQLPKKVGEPTFNDPKWFWKASCNILSKAFNSRISLEARRFSPTQDKRRKDGHFQFIPRRVDDLMRMLVYAHKYLTQEDSFKRPMFLDCGCGVGNVVMLAEFAGFDAYGIEYDKATLAAGKELLKEFRLDPKKLFQGDILEYSDYQKYDVLYTFCPMVSTGKEWAFEQKLKHDMKVGALLLGMRAGRVVGTAGKGGVVARTEETEEWRAYFQVLCLEDADRLYARGNPCIKVDQE